MFWILIHGETNSSTWIAVVIRPLSNRIQLLFRSSSWTDMFFLLTNNARCLGASLSSQLLCQKRAFSPLPIVTFVDASKSSRSRTLQGNSAPAQGLESSTQSCHNQRRRRALPNFSKSDIPSLPRSLGLNTVGQLTKQCPLFAFSSPFQRNDLLILSIFFLAQAASGNTVRW
jgi:hypothetical protein